uniref:Monooxygenase n=1 Tax=Coccidioides posadasii RMSCC 3488 TaxID=454284 RepID=A0A0J6FB14_COCPO|nr:monooxygenase [Coccidioides posadasii RMSCC 3488]
MAQTNDIQPPLGSNNPNIDHPASIDRPMFCSEWPVSSPSGYKITDHMVNEAFPERASFKIAMLGAGAAGIDFLHHAILAFKDDPDVDLVVYEKNHDIGGTWLENRYPGCACDVPSASYQFPWRPNPGWTMYYSTSREIWEYLRKIVEEEGMMRYIRLRTAIVHAAWLEPKSKWVLHLVEKNEKDEVVREWDEEFDMFLSGAGILNAWKWPDIPGLHSFKGRLFHTARYEEGFDLKGKSVAVIGSGSSGVQTVAAIYNDVSKLYTWVRTPTWITPGFAQKYAGPDGKNFAYSEEQKDIWRAYPEKYRSYRKMIEDELNGRFRFVLRNSKESDDAILFSHREMSSKLGNNTHLISKIIPQNFNVGCRRPTPGNGYLEALVGSKTTCYTESIGGITPNGFLTTDGTEVNVDVIICATGFDTTFRPRFPIIGLDGKNIADRWENRAESYISVSVSNVPNYFMYGGPYSPVAQGSILPILTLLSNHFIQVIKKMRKEHIRRLSPKESAMRDFVEHASVYLQRTAWADPCSSWFKQGKIDGNIVMWPGSRLAFFDLIKEPKYEDYEIEYWSGNRWGYLGNGFSTVEFDGSDISSYLNCELFPQEPAASKQEEKVESNPLHSSAKDSLNSKEFDSLGLLQDTPGFQVAVCPN